MKPIDLEQVARELEHSIYIASAELDAKDWPNEDNAKRIAAALRRVVRQAADEAEEWGDLKWPVGVVRRNVLAAFGLSEEG